MNKGRAFSNIGLSLAMSGLLVACGGGPKTPKVADSPSSEANVDFGSVTLSVNNNASLTKNLVVTLAATAQNAAEMYITEDASCASGGSWTAYAASSSFTLLHANAVNSLHMKVRKGTKESTCVNANSITHDGIAPTLAITAPASGSWINSAQVAAVAVSGTCSEEGRSVSLSGGASGSAMCTSGAWTANLNFSAAAQGALTLTASLADAAGNSTATSPLALQKDTVAPTGSFQINGGAAFTNSLNATLSLVGTGATQMKIGETALCLAGSWEPFAASKSWTLGSPNAVNTIYVMYRDDAGNDSACLSQMITHDNIVPTLSFDLPVENAYANIANAGAFVLSGTCSDNGRDVVLTGAVSAVATCTSGAWSYSANLAAVSDGAFTVTADFTDAAGNTATSVQHHYVKDVAAPTLSFVSPASGSVANVGNVASFTISGACSENGEAVTISGAATDSVSCSGGSWSKSLDLSALSEGAFSLTVHHMDVAGNSATAVTMNYVKDSLPPTLTLTAPVTGSFVNIANHAAFALSGTCSDEGRNVVLSGSVSATAVCTSGAWNKTLDLSAVADGSMTIHFNHTDIGGNSAPQVDATYTKDVVAPTLSFDSPADNSFVNAGNVASFVLSGTCSEETRSVAITGAVTDAATCTGGAWSKTLDLSSQAEGALTFTVNLDDAVGNVAPTVTLHVTKDVASPTLALTSPASGGFINIANNAAVAFTGTCSEDGRLVVIGGDVSDSATCTTGSWSKTLDLSGFADGSISLTFNHNDVSGNAASAVNATYTKDVVAPTLSFVLPVDNSYVNAGNIAGFTISGACSENGRLVVINGDVSTNATCTAGAWSKAIDLSGLADGAITLNAYHSDLAGNTVTPVTMHYTKDVGIPTLTLTAPTSGSYINIANNAAVAFSGTCSENTRDVVISGAVSSTATCTAGAWSKTLDLSGVADGAVALAFNHSDTSGNAAVTVNATYTKDVVAPTLTFTSPTSGGYVNASNVASLSLTGACSENTRNVVISGAVSSTATCTAGAWSKSLNLTAVADGAISLTVNHADAASNPATAVTVNLTKDVGIPTLTLTAPTSGSYINIANNAAVAFSGTCSENTRNVVISGAVSSTATCTAGAWSKTLDLSGVADGAVAIAFNHGDAAGNNATTVNATYTKDVVAPTLTLTSPVSGAYINAANAAVFTMSGTCSENTRNVVISGAVSSTATCTAGAWSKALNLSGLSNGAVTINLNHGDAASNAATQVVANYTKDTAAPTGNSLVINANASYTTDASVTLTLASTGATQMYVTDVSDCSSGGSWETLGTSKAWTLSNTNAAVSVYAKYTDDAGNESSCVGDSIIHDDVVPVWSSVPTHAAIFASLTDSPDVTYDENATDDNGILKYQYAVGTGTSGANATNRKGWTDISGGSFTASGMTLTNGATYYINMKVIDNVGNETPVSSVGWLVDTTPPSLTITAPLASEMFTETDVKVSGVCDNAYPISITYDPDVTGPASATCSSGIYSFFVEISGASGPKGVTVEQTDGANTTTQSVDINYQKSLSIGGQVLAALRLSDGSQILGGNFVSVSSSQAFGIVRTDANGVQDSTFKYGAGFNGIVYAVAELADGSWIVGGDFTKYRNRIANRIAKVSSTGDIDLTFNPQTGNNGANNIVRAITVSGTSIYVGGDFTTYRGTTVTRLVKIDSSGVRDSSFNTGGTVGCASSIYSMGVSGSSLYVGGAFTTCRGSAANRIAKLSASTGAIDTTFNPTSGNNGANNTVRAIAFDSGGDIYIGGDFTSYRGTTANRFARVTTAGVLNNTNYGTCFNAAVWAIAVSGSNIYVGGLFTTYKTSGVANRIAKVATDGTLDTTFNPSAGNNGFGNGQVNALWVTGSAVYAGGTFTQYRTATASAAAKLSLSGVLDTTYNPATSNGNGANGTVNAVQVGSAGVVWAGAFTGYRGEYAANYIVKLDAAGDVDTTFNPQGSANGFNGIVRALALSGTNIIVGGDFTLYEGSAANRVAKLSSSGVLDTTFSPTSGNNGANNVVRAIAVSGSDIFIGGDFTTYRAATATRLVKLNQSGVADATFNVATGANSSIYAIATDGTNLYLGGLFGTYKSSTANRVTKVNYSTAAIDTTFSPTSGSNGTNTGGTIYVYSLVLDNGSLYLGGTFTTYRGTTVNRIAKVNSSGVLDTTFTSTGTVGFASTVWSMVSDGSALYVAGAFATYRGVAASGVAKLNLTSGALQTAFTTAGGLSGTGFLGTAVAVNSSGLTLGGLFSFYRLHNWGNLVSVDLTDGSPQ